MNCRAIELNVCFSLFKEVLDQPSVAFRPRNQRLRFSRRRAHPRTEVKQTCPRTGLLERHAVVVATSVVDPPAKSRTGETTLVHPFAHGNTIERGDLGVIGTGGHGKRERTPAFSIPPRNPLVHFGVELLKLLFVVFTFTGVKIESLVPAAFAKEAFLRIATEKLL